MKVQILMNIKFSLYTVAQYLEYKRKQLWGLNKTLNSGRASEQIYTLQKRSVA